MSADKVKRPFAEVLDEMMEYLDEEDFTSEVESLLCSYYNRKPAAAETGPPRAPPEPYRMILPGPVPLFGKAA